MAYNFIVVPPRYPLPWIEDAVHKGAFDHENNTTLLVPDHCFVQGSPDLSRHLRSISFGDWGGRRIDELRYLAWVWKLSSKHTQIALLQYMNADQGLKSSLWAVFALMLFHGRIRVIHPVPVDPELSVDGTLPMKWVIHELSLGSTVSYLSSVVRRRLPDRWTVLYWCFFSGVLVKSFARRPIAFARGPKAGTGGPNSKS
jgi:hypothetical protein